jgi:hypothetical protein
MSIKTQKKEEKLAFERLDFLLFFSKIREARLPNSVFAENMNG